MLTLAMAPALACQPAGTRVLAASLAGIDRNGDLILSDQGRARLAGVRMLLPSLGQPDTLAAALDRSLARWREPTVTLLRTEAGPDRWGRLTVSVTADGTRPDDLALALVRQGYAMAWPQELTVDCRAPYLRAEDAARRAGQGHWADPRHATLDAAEGVNVAARAGQVAIIAGRINHVGQTRRATYLNFGARGTGASAELDLATWRVLERQGWTREGLRGKTVRVRGVVSEGNPARLLLGDASALELLN